MTQPKPSLSPNFGLRNRRSRVGAALGLLAGTLTIAWGCSPPPLDPPVGYTGGAPAGTGGAPAATGGAPAGTGGAPAATGGAPAATGGAPAATGGAPAGTVPECVTATLAAQCTVCHSTAAAPFFGGLDLSGDFVPRLLDKAATYNAVPDDQKASCTPGAKLIDPETPDNSVFLKKINGMQSCGAAMPSGGQLMADQKACLVAWIQTF